MTQADLLSAQSVQALPPLVRRTLDRLVRAFAPERIVLFGSHAKGTVRKDSDVDLLVIAPMEGDPGRHLRRAKQLAADCFPPVDIVLATPTEVEQAASAKSPFLLSILGTGQTIYLRSALHVDRNVNSSDSRGTLSTNGPTAQPSPVGMGRVSETDSTCM